MKKNHIKNNLIYYRSVVDRVVTGLSLPHYLFWQNGKIALQKAEI